MIKRILDILKEFKEVSDYRLIHTESKSYQAYYIKENIETTRVVDLANTYALTLYVDYDNLRGSSTVSLHASFSDEEIRNSIVEGIKETNFSKNTYFALPSGETLNFEKTLEHFSVDDCLRVGEAVLSSNTYKEGYISALEVFIKETKLHLINSKGVDYTTNSSAVNLEIIATFKGEKEVELYKALDYERIDLAKIKEDTKEFLAEAALRNKATSYSGENKINCLFNVEEIRTILSNLVSNLDYAYCYNKMDLLKVGDKFYGNGLDTPNISLVPLVDNSIANQSFDLDGIVLKPVEIVKDNKVLTNHGSNQYAYYLGIKDATGILPNLKVSSGKGIDYTKPYLHCLAFSSFQFDLNSGNFGGEVRLAKLVKGDIEVAVTALTVSGNIHELKEVLHFSEEVVSTNRYEGPKFLMIEGMNVN